MISHPEFTSLAIAMRQIALTFMSIVILLVSNCYAQDSVLQSTTNLSSSMFGAQTSSDSLLEESFERAAELPGDSQIAFDAPDDTQSETPVAYSSAHSKIILRTLQFTAFAVVAVVGGIAGYRFYLNRRKRDPHQWDARPRRKQRR